MKRFQKKIFLMCATALICAGVVCFGGCSSDLWTLDDVATTSSTFYVLGYIEGVEKGIEDSEVELKSKNLIDEWWSGLEFVQWWRGIFATEETPETDTDTQTQPETEGTEAESAQ